MSLDSMRKQVNKLLEEIERRHPPAPDGEAYAFTMSLFSDEEQERLHCFLGQVESRLQEWRNGHMILSKLTGDELDQLHLWFKLEHALQAEDHKAASRARRWLSQSREQVVQAFQSLDLSFLPTDLNAPSLTITEGHCIYPLNRTEYRYMEGVIERGRVGASTLDSMRRWLDYAHNRAISQI